MVKRTSFLIFPAFLCMVLMLISPVDAQSVNARNLLKMSRSYASENDWAKAKSYADKALAEEPGYLDALYMRAFAYRETEQFEKAEKDFNEVIRRDPNYLPTYGALADMYIKQKEYDKADEVFASLSNVAKGKKWASYYRGVVAYLKNDLPKAETFWREALNQDTNFASAHHNLGALYLAQGNHGKALASFRSALQQKPEMPMYRFHVAWALERSGQTAEAQEILKKIMNENAEDQKFWLLARGLDRLIRKQSAQAAEVLSTVSESSPENLDVWVLLGRANLALNKPEEARAALEKAKEMDGAFKEIDDLLSKLPAPKPKPEPEPKAAPESDEQPTPDKASEPDVPAVPAETVAPSPKP